MDFEIDPFQAVGPIRFGMTQAEVRRLMGQTRVREFRKTPDSIGPTDDFMDENLHVFYDETLHTRGVELFPGATVTLQGRPLVGRPANEVMDWLRGLDPDLQIEDSSVTSERLGFSMYVPDLDDEDDAPIESVYVFRRRN